MNSYLWHLLEKPALEEVAEEVVAVPPKKRAFERTQRKVPGMIEKEETAEGGPCRHPGKCCPREIKRAQTPKVVAPKEVVREQATAARLCLQLSCWVEEGEEEEVAWRVLRRQELCWSWTWLWI